MDRCETCGNSYSNCFEISMQGETHTFDCFECAISALAPRCEACGVRIIGHGMEDEAHLYCCANCARLAGVAELKDHSIREY